MKRDSQQLDVKDLVKEFESGDQALRILDGITISLDQGENLAVVGPSGSGKSTFLHIVGTLDSPTSGSVELYGKNPFDLDEPDLATFRNENVGFVFQEHHLLPQLTALENVLVPSLAKGPTTAESATRATQLLDRVGLGKRLAHRPGKLSGGERQRVAVARAMLNEPKILLCDEPTGSLDNVNAQAIGRMLLEIQQQENVMLVCVTHNDELAGLFQKQVRLENGKFQ